MSTFIKPVTYEQLLACRNAIVVLGDCNFSICKIVMFNGMVKQFRKFVCTSKIRGIEKIKLLDGLPQHAVIY